MKVLEGVQRRSKLGPAEGLWMISRSVRLVGPSLPCYLGASVRNRWFPYVNIARRIRDTMTLKIIQESYDLHKDLDLSVYVERSPDCSSKCECFTFFSGAIYLRLKLILDPRALLTPQYKVHVTNPLLLKITKYLITLFGISPSNTKAYVPKVVLAWGRVRIANCGNLI